MGVNRNIKNFIRGTCFGLIVDIVVLTNAAAVGWEVGQDSKGGSLVFIVRTSILALYWFEFFCRWKAGIHKRINVLVDVIIVLGASIDVWIIGDDSGPTYSECTANLCSRMWRLTLLRLHRLLRIVRVAETFPPLKELWLVLSGLRRAAKALVYFMLLTGAVIFGGAGIVRGLMRLEDDGVEILFGNSTSFNDEYFGSLSSAGLTLLQLITLDGWASSVVRPLQDRPWTSAFLIFFVIVTAYSLLSLAVGVLVWSTVELARHHATHADHKSATEDKEIIGHLRDFYIASLSMQDRQMLDLREVTESMSTPQVRNAFKLLDLPVNDVKELFSHIDKKQVGEMTVDQFEKGILTMKMPATTFDIACLTANLGGSVAFCEGLCERTDTIMDHIVGIGASLQVAFNELTHLVCDEDQMGKVPEVILRRDGVIKVEPPPPTRPRYTR